MHCRRLANVAVVVGLITSLAVALALQSCGRDDGATPVDPCTLGLVPADELTTPPIRLSIDPPHYPDAARLAGWSGSGTCYAIINADSTLCDCGIVVSSGREDVDEQILVSAWTAVFTPGMVNGTMVRSRVEMTYTFTLPAVDNVSAPSR